MITEKEIANILINETNKLENINVYIEYEEHEIVKNLIFYLYNGKLNVINIKRNTQEIYGVENIRKFINKLL